MALSPKDLVTTVLAAGTGIILYIQNKGIEVTILSSPRWASVLVFAFGLGMCITGGQYEMYSTRWGIGMGISGALVLLAAILGLITNDKVYVEIGAVIVLVMWLLSTGRHAAL